jgi:hypothetical protein
VMLIGAFAVSAIAVLLVPRDCFQSRIIHAKNLC